MSPLIFTRARPPFLTVLRAAISAAHTARASFGSASSFGCPTVGGETTFHPCYNGNILVNAFTLGIARIDSIFRGRAGAPYQGSLGACAVGHSTPIAPSEQKAGPSKHIRGGECPRTGRASPTSLSNRSAASGQRTPPRRAGGPAGPPSFYGTPEVTP